MSTCHCIYGQFDPAASFTEEHYLPVGVGRFDGMHPLANRVCATCNREIGTEVEQDLNTVSPVALYRRLAGVGPTIEDSGSHGSPPIQLHGSLGEQPNPLLFEVNPVTRGLGTRRQIVVQTADGSIVNVPIGDAQTSRRAIERALNQAGCLPGQLRSVVLFDDEDALLATILEFFPGAKQATQDALVADGRSVTVRARVSTTPRYYRAVAKIAFHYVLAHYPSLFIGNEHEFRPIRTFIRNGKGQPSDFIYKSTEDARPPLAPTPPHDHWQHTLSAIVRRDQIVVFVYLFVGPGTNGEQHAVMVGRNPCRTWHGVDVIAHRFILGAPGTPRGHDGVMIDAKPSPEIVAELGRAKLLRD